MDRTRVLLLFGGESSEHDVSISSARNVYAAIDDEKYDVQLGYIDRQGKWWLLESFDMNIDVHGGRQLLPVLGGNTFITVPDNQIIQADVILPILHGHGGEDGSVQGMAQLLHIPIVGCDVTASSIGMDKIASKEIAAASGIAVVPYIVHRQYESLPDFAKLSMTLGSPLFVKPARAGSSVGVSKAHSEEELAAALQLAHKHDKVALIEQSITARELEIAVLGTPPKHRISGVGEIVPGADFYNYDDKYASDSKAVVTIPADISENTKLKIQSMAGTIYEVLGCSGLSRIDFFLGDDEKVYFNEINTIPGFTNISMYPKLWRSEGINYPELIELLITDSLANATIHTES
ncbi:MAG: ddl, D-alanyl-alanine synthetase D-alanine-D-alanine ligase [Candidatus Saccharibacteria bacterium]|nr:ddl, D-alanyl-alanine synthetase D-alanine-D-alanine ligase [Candidatus Saccharibacteria bacterium]